MSKHQRIRDDNCDNEKRLDVSHSRELGYLSAAPRVSTRLDAEASGPRAHVMGVMCAFKELGWGVHPYIVGDRIPHSLTTHSEEKLNRSAFIRLGADFARLGMGIYHSFRAWRELKEKVDWVYERFATLQSLGWIFQRKGIPWILETSGLFFYEAKVERKSIFLWKVAKIMELWVYRQCDVLICVSDALKELIIKNAEISPEKILVVPNGVDIDRFDPTRCKPKRFFDECTLGFVGALLNWHRLDILIDAMADLRKESISLKLVVVGDGPMRIEWENRAKKFGMQEDVLFVGQVSWEQIPAYMAGFDLGFMGNAPMEIGVMYHSPLKLYEYMAMRLPVVASSYPDSQAVIEHGKNGFLFVSGDKNDLTRILRVAYHDRARWKNMGNTARELIREKASWLIRVRDMELRIKEILTIKS